jgi:DNA repair protein SbcC/Rad50
VEKEMNELNILRKELSLSEAGITHKIEQNNRLNLEIKNLKSQIEAIKKELDGRIADDSKAIAEKINEKEKELKEAEVNYESAIKKIRGIEVNLENSAETIKKVSSLDICPVCEQKVDENHKHGISEREGKKHEKFLESLKSLKENQENTEKARQMLRKELDGLVRGQHQANVIKVRVQNLKEKQGMSEEKSALKDKIKKDIGILNAKKIELKPRIERFAKSEERYKSVKKELDDLLPQEKFLEVEKGKCESAIDSIKKFMARMNKEISEKEKAKESLNKIGQIANWMDEMFTNLMSNMEKHVMVSIHRQFNELFRKWFDVIMEDESLNVRVDEEFTPLIEQNGYETYIENLSGGEKTSVALSYRLALNKVVNDIVAGIKTKDIIMLDEPTDGFSTEQLDKVRDVLQQLNMRQAIIVSHESKIEGFVQNVIRVEKRDNVSVVV